ncbi:Scr1 family TA system antitoxin-like transcriptional regulator [Streptomyces sp. NPDC001948]
MGRQAVATGESPTPYLGIVHEAALRLEFGGQEVSRRQLDHLADASELDHVTLLAIPFSAGPFHGDGQSVLYAEGPVPHSTRSSSTPRSAANSLMPQRHWGTLVPFWT